MLYLHWDFYICWAFDSRQNRKEGRGYNEGGRQWWQKGSITRTEQKREKPISQKWGTGKEDVCLPNLSKKTDVEKRNYMSHFLARLLWKCLRAVHLHITHSHLKQLDTNWGNPGLNGSALGGETTIFSLNLLPPGHIGHLKKRMWCICIRCAGG